MSRIEEQLHVSKVWAKGVRVVKVESMEIIRYGPHVKSGVDEDKKVWAICKKWE